MGGELERRRELVGRGDRRLAGEVLANVGGGGAVDGLTALEERNSPVRIAAREHQVGAIFAIARRAAVAPD